MKKHNNVHFTWKTNQKGITLIALVITIIVLLILAGVTINLTLGQNGIFTTAQKAAKNYTEAQEKELADINSFTNTADQIIYNVTGGNPTLVSQIQPSDYGKSINYSVTVKNSSNEDVTLTDWKVFYNDGTNVYIILSDYLNNSLIPTVTGMTLYGTYNAYWESVADNTEAVATLKNTNYWSEFAGGNGGSTAIGSPTYEMFAASWNANPSTNTITLTAGSYASGLTDSTGLYIPHTNEYESCGGFWLASPGAAAINFVWNVPCIGAVGDYYFDINCYGLRPVVCLTTGITGTVGDAVTID